MTKDVTKLKIFEGSLFSIIQLSPKCNHMYPLKKEAEEVLRGNRRKQWDHVATSQGMSTATRSWKRQGMHSSLESLKEEQPCRHLDFRLVASKNVRQYISVVFSNLLWQPQETNTMQRQARH